MSITNLAIMPRRPDSPEVRWNAPAKGSFPYYNQQGQKLLNAFWLACHEVIGLRTHIPVEGE